MGERNNFNHQVSFGVAECLTSNLLLLPWARENWWGWNCGRNPERRELSVLLRVLDHATLDKYLQ